MFSLKKSKQSGFTIVELLIVIVVIGILATLVIVTFTGVQQKARDTKRETDVKALASQLEAYFAQNASYPDLTDLQNATWVKANLKGLDTAGLIAPNGKLANGATTTITGTIPDPKDPAQYVYVVGPTNCTTNDKNCLTFTITAQKESSDTPITKSNLSN